jgi:hypothetical protein
MPDRKFMFWLDPAATLACPEAGDSEEDQRNAVRAEERRLHTGRHPFHPVPEKAAAAIGGPGFEIPPPPSGSKALGTGRKRSHYRRACRSQEIPMTLTVAHVTPLVALIAGILILIMPRLLNYIVAIYLIFVGLVGLNSIHHFIR